MFFMCWHLVPVGLREHKAFKGYHNCWSLLLNMSSLSAGAFECFHWLQTQTGWKFHPFLNGLFFSAFCLRFLLWSTVACCCFWFWIWCGRPEVSSIFLHLSYENNFPKEFWLVPKIFLSLLNNLYIRLTICVDFLLKGHNFILLVTKLSSTSSPHIAKKQHRARLSV